MSKKLSVKMQDGLVLIIIGVFFLLQSLNIISWDILWYAVRLWPLALIIAGANMLINKPWVKYAGVIFYVVCTIAFYIFHMSGYSIEFIM